MFHASKSQVCAAFAASCMLLTSPAAASMSAGMSVTDPLVALSAFGTSSSRAAVCASSSAAAASASAAATAAAANAGQPAGGCVLPVLGSPPPIAEVPVGAAPVAVAGGGLSSILPLAAIALFGLLAIARLERKNDTPASPF